MTNSTHGPSEQGKTQGKGLIASVQGLMATLVAIFHTRLELMITEIEEEKRRLLATVAWGAAGVLLACFGVAFLAVFITVLFWDSHRLLVLGVVALVFLIGSVVAMSRVRALFRQSGLMLSATRAELEADFRTMGDVRVDGQADQSKGAP